MSDIACGNGNCAERMAEQGVNSQKMIEPAIKRRQDVFDSMNLMFVIL